MRSRNADIANKTASIAMKTIKIACPAIEGKKSRTQTKCRNEYLETADWKSRRSGWDVWE
jgi:hypothetical protein